MEREIGTTLAGIQQRIQRLYDDQTSLEGFFDDVVALICSFSGAESCSLYFYDSEREALRLRATGGPHPDPDAPELVGRAEGIIGIAVSELRTIRASSNGPEFASEMVVPVRRGPRRLAAVVLKHQQSDFFDEPAERALKALFAQLGATLQSASYVATLRRQGARQSPDSSYLIHGQTASRGTVHGYALPWETGFGDDSEDPVKDASAVEALARFEASLELSHRQLEAIHRDSDSSLYDVVSLIFGAHLLMLGDEAFSGEMRNLIRAGTAPVLAVRQVVNQYADTLSAISDSRMAEKAQDVRDLGHRLIRNLIDPLANHFDYSNAIVIAHSIYPSELVTLVAQNVGGVVFSGSGVTAHIAILARSLSVPVLITQDQRVFQLAEHTPLVLDASAGRLYVNPHDDGSPNNSPRRAADGWSVNRVASAVAHAAVDRTQATEAAGRHGVAILANVNLLGDARIAARNHASGIGLYRSEFPFIIRNDFLSEEEQIVIYRRIIDSFSGSEITLRTADIGGDKLLENSGPREQNPFLGVRGIRFSLANRDVFREQLRAMLRAGVGEDLRIMFPMVSSVEEVLEAREEVERCIYELRNEGVQHNEQPRLGAMVELPSAVEAIDDLAAATDFLSIGTNDLVMYLLAVDRTNERLSELYRSYHPIVLRVLKRIVDGVGPKRGELSVCGDSAGDPFMIPFYLGIGVRKLSIQSGELPRIYRTLASLAPKEAERIACEMLAIRKISEMEHYLEELHGKG